MPADTNRPTVREAVGVFNDADTLEAAIDALEESGFDRADLSFLASEDTVEEKLGHRYQRVGEMEDDPDAPRTVFVSTESVGAAEGALIGGLIYVGALAAAGAVVASGGALVPVIGAAAVGAGVGGGIGGVLADLVGEEHADSLREQLDRGGLLLWVHIRDPDHEGRALEILRKHSAHDVHVHDLPT